MDLNTDINTTFFSRVDEKPATMTHRPEPILPVYVTVYVTAINILVFVTGVVGNVLVIVVVTRVKDMRTTMNLYLVNLSMADLLVLLVCQPTAMLELYAKERWFLGAALCKLIPALEHTTMHASTLTIVVITLERYHAICRPLDVFLRCNRPRPLCTLLCVWTVAVGTSLPFVTMTNLEPTVFFDGTPCEYCKTTVYEVWHYCFHLASTATFFIFPLLLLTVLYSSIIKKLYRSDIVNRRVSFGIKESTGYSLRSRKQVIRMLVTLVVLFFLSLAPLRVVIIWQIFSSPESVPRLGIENYYNLIWSCRLLMYLNSAANPLIYSLFSSKFKIAFSFLLRCQTSMLEHRNRQRPLLHNLVHLHRRPTNVEQIYKYPLSKNSSILSSYKGSLFQRCSSMDICVTQGEHSKRAVCKAEQDRHGGQEQGGPALDCQNR